MFIPKAKAFVLSDDILSGLFVLLRASSGEALQEFESYTGRSAKGQDSFKTILFFLFPPKMLFGLFGK